MLIYFYFFFSANSIHLKKIAKLLVFSFYFFFFFTVSLVFKSNQDGLRKKVLWRLNFDSISTSTSASTKS